MLDLSPFLLRGLIIVHTAPARVLLADDMTTIGNLLLAIANYKRRSWIADFPICAREFGTRSVITAAAHRIQAPFVDCLHRLDNSAGGT